jgi:trans-aconitate 2-methyltransferase
MIARARSTVPGVAFEVADLRTWAAATGQIDERVDVVVSHATLQWLPDHLDLLPALVDRVDPDGWLAIQVPGNFGEPSHVIRAELAAEAPYAAHTGQVHVPASHDPEVYLETLAGLGCRVDVWETTYLHVLTGPDPVFTWVSGTGARPTLQALPGELRPAFEEEFKRRLRAGYPERDGRVVLPFRRIFAVARTPGGRR